MCLDGVWAYGTKTYLIVHLFCSNFDRYVNQPKAYPFGIQLYESVNYHDGLCKSHACGFKVCLLMVMIEQVAKSLDWLQVNDGH